MRFETATALIRLTFPIGILARGAGGSAQRDPRGGDHTAIYFERCAVRWLMELVSSRVLYVRGRA
jgi:hypothetical protein